MNEITITCPCSKEMIDDKETTGGLKCPDDCDIMYHNGNLFIGRMRKKRNE